MIKTRRNVATQLQMLFLVFANRHIIRPINQNIRRLQNRVAEQTRRHKRLIVFYFQLLALVFELRHFRQFTKTRHAIQHPTQLRMFRHKGLNEQVFGFYAAREKLKRHFPRIFTQICRFIRHCHRMAIYNAIETTVFFLKLQPIFDRAKIVAEVQIACGLDA